MAFENASTPIRMSLFACQFKQCVVIDYHFHVPTILKSGNFKQLEPSGPVQASTGIALPYPNLYLYLVLECVFLNFICALSSLPLLFSPKSSELSKRGKN